MSVEVAAKNTCTTVTEGPHWEDKSQSLIYVDIYAGDVHRYNPETGSDIKIHTDDTVGYIVPRKKGGYVVGYGRKFALFDFDSGITETIQEVEQGTKNRFNDGKCDSSGRIWAGTMGAEDQPAVVTPNLGSLYSLGKEGSLRKHVSNISISNGLAWSPDDRIMYYIDSIPRKVYAFDYNATSGDISNQRVVVDFETKEDSASFGFPDGMCIDQQGMLWVACFNGSKVSRFDPNTGQEIQKVIIPARKVTSCCFGGKNHDDLYVTASRMGVTAEEVQAEPLSGSVFKVTGLGVKGFPGQEYCG